jgi:protein SCO1
MTHTRSSAQSHSSVFNHGTKIGLPPSASVLADRSAASVAHRWFNSFSVPPSLRPSAPPSKTLLFIAAIALTACNLAPLRAGEAPSVAPPSPAEGVAIEQRLGNSISLDNRFLDETGREVELREYFGRRPVVLMLGYYECPMLCNQVLHGLIKVLNGVDFQAGRHFELVIVSIAPDETPTIGLRKREAFLAQYHHGAQAAGGVHFLTGTESNIRRLADEVGYRYRYEPQSRRYAHAAGVMIATPSGKLARYFYGIDYATRDMRYALIEAADERLGSTVDQVLLLCFHYDPTTGRYGLAIMRLMRVAGLLTVVGLGGFIALMIRRERRRPA